MLFAGGGGGYGYPLFTSYAAAKVALVRFVETLAIELGPPEPTITIIAPGANETDTLAEIRRAGAIVKTVVDISEPCRLVRRLLLEDSRGLHGRFIHVRDEWTAPASRRSTKPLEAPAGRVMRILVIGHGLIGKQRARALNALARDPRRTTGRRATRRYGQSPPPARTLRRTTSRRSTRSTPPRTTPR